MMAKKYLIKIDGKLSLVPVSQLDNLTPTEAANLSLHLIEEQKEQLMKDALNKKDRLYYKYNVVKSLEDSLSHLKEKFPFLHEHLNALSVRKVIN